MYVDQVVAMFKALVDEPDETFEDAADIAVLAETAHNELRSIIADSPSVKMILTRQNFTVAGARFYDFADVANATVLLGAGPLAPVGAQRIHVIKEIAELDANLRPTVHYRGVTDETQLWRLDVGYAPAYFFEGTQIHFGTDVNATFRMKYVPVLDIDWTRQTSGDDEFIDDFYHYHDLIALKMAEQYMIRDGEINAPLQRRIDSRMLAFDFFTQSGRDKGPGREVEVEPRNFWE